MYVTSVLDKNVKECLERFLSALVIELIESNLGCVRMNDPRIPATSLTETSAAKRNRRENNPFADPVLRAKMGYSLGEIIVSIVNFESQS